VDTRTEWHRIAGTSRRRRPSRSHLLTAAIVLALGTVPVLVPLLVLDRADRTVAEAPPEPGPGVPALPRSTASEPAPRPTGPAVSRRGSRSAVPAPAAGPLEPSTPAPTTTRTTRTTPAGTPTGTRPPPAPRPAGSARSASPSTTTGSPTALVAAPDLVVESVAWSPEQPAAGNAVTFSAVVRNAGSEATPAVTHGVAFLVDGTKVSWSAGDATPLAPGEQRTYTADGGPAGPSWPAAAGEHTVQAWVDDTGSIGETTDDNNTFAAALTVA
jgi:hypothetical protein